MTQQNGLQCPKHKGDTGGSDSYSFNETTQQGYCHSCDLSTWVDDRTNVVWGKYGSGKYFVVDDSGKTDDLEELFEETKETPKVSSKASYRSYRGVSQDTMEFFKVLTEGNQQFYTYPDGAQKIRNIEKKGFISNGNTSGQLFGAQLFPPSCSKILTVTEGELDAMSAYQILSSKSSYTNPVVAIPGATPNKKLWDDYGKYLDSFEKIILSLDNDDPGRKLAETFFDLYPNKVYVMNHGTLKDANEFLMEGKGNDYRQAWWSAKRYSPSGFTVDVEDWVSVVRDETPYDYVPTFSEALNRGMRGWVRGGITVVKAPPGIGKTSLFRAAQYDLVMDQKATVANLAMEEVRSTTGRGLVSYDLGANVNTKEDAETNGISEETIEGSIRKIMGDGRYVAFDIDPTNAMESVLTQIKHSVAIYEADVIFIDHLQRLAYLHGTEGATSALTELGVQLAEFAKRRGVAIVCISHVNQDGFTKYAKAIEEEAIVLLELSRDKFADTPQERNRTYLTITKNRPFGYVGEAGVLTYDPETTLMSEHKGSKAPDPSNAQEDF